MTRQRVRAAVRKATERAVRAESEQSPPVVIGDGVRAVAAEIEGTVIDGSLYWQAPLQYVVEQMAPRICTAYKLPREAADDVAAYLLAGLNEYVVALAGHFDLEHFQAWTAAAAGREEAAGG